MQMARSAARHSIRVSDVPEPSAPRVELAEGSERRKYLHPVGIHMGNFDWEKRRAGSRSALALRDERSVAMLFTIPSLKMPNVDIEGVMRHRARP